MYAKQFYYRTISCVQGLHPGELKNYCLARQGEVLGGDVEGHVEGLRDLSRGGGELEDEGLGVGEFNFDQSVDAGCLRNEVVGVLNTKVSTAQS